MISYWICHENIIRPTRQELFYVLCYIYLVNGKSLRKKEPLSTTRGSFCFRFSTYKLVFDAAPEIVSYHCVSFVLGISTAEIADHTGRHPPGQIIYS